MMKYYMVITMNKKGMTFFTSDSWKKNQSNSAEQSLFVLLNFYYVYEFYTVSNYRDLLFNVKVSFY